MPSDQSISIPQFGQRENMHTVHLSNVTPEEARALRLWARYKKEEILNDCVNNPAKYIDNTEL